MLVKPPMEVTQAVIKSLADLELPTRKDLMRIIRKQIKGTHYRFPLATELWEAYRLLQEEGFAKSEKIERVLRVKDVRTDSGVAPITVLTKPYPCPGECVYCPLEDRMPKSYISSEPAAARALSLEFDPYEQVSQRVRALERNGHTANKIELIVKGATWSAYPQDYREWFVQRCFEAANELDPTPQPPCQGEIILPKKIEDLKKAILQGLPKITDFFYIPYRNDLKELAKNNRRLLTPAEQKVWNELLSNKQLLGLKFLRQKPLGHYIADFYCSKLMLIVEIDDKSHEQKVEQDFERNRYLKTMQIKTIRFTNEDVFGDLEKVKHEIIKQIYLRVHEILSQVNSSPPDKGDLGGSSVAENNIGGSSSLMDTSTLKNSLQQNETAAYRIIGLTIETRPDWITAEEVIHLRRLGVTRVELGLQIINDRVLEISRRGTTVDDAARAIGLLKSAGFKVDVHIMPGLPGASIEDDLESFRILFEDPRFRPDMIKIYPCVVLPNSELADWFARGDYKPLEGEDLKELLIQMQAMIPRYCRVSRMIRDFPSQDIAEGNKDSNLREMLEAEMRRRGISCQCLRCREVGHVPGDHKKDKTTLFEERYENADGTEVFLSIENEDRTAVFGFCRLRLPFSPLTKGVGGIHDAFPILRTSAFIRELHTYGTALNINQQDEQASQHKGYGRQLMQGAEQIAKKEGYSHLAVISGIGVREYYKMLGYHEQDTYMVKAL